MTPAPVNSKPVASSPISQTSWGIGLGVLATVIWGTYLAMARAGVSSGLEAADVALLRFATAAAILLPWLLSHNLFELAGVGWKRGIALALLAGPAFILVGVGGYQFAPLAHGAVFQPAALTIGGMALAAILLGDTFTRTRMVGAGIIVLGLSVVAGPGLLASGSLTLVGDTMFVVSGLMWALFAALTRMWGIGPVPATAVVSVLSATAFVPWFIATQSFDRLAALPDSQLLAQVLIQGVLSGVVAVLAFTKAVQILGAGRAAVFPAIVPAVAILMGIPIAHEIPNALQGAGILVVLAGLLTAMGLLKLPRRLHFA